MSFNKSVSQIFSVLFVIGFMLAISPLQAVRAAVVRYAKPSASGSGDCMSWANACSLQTALAASVSSDEIWATAGTHKPASGIDRASTFQLIDGVALYGGFAGTESERIQRNPATHQTILSGDIDDNDSQTPIITDLTTVTGNTTNSYHVVTGADNAVLDGFTITAGFANGEAWESYGGGLMADYVSPTINNVTLSGNSALSYGGGMYNTSNTPSLTDVIFTANMANQGGGMINEASNPVLTNVTFSGNSAQEGGGMSNKYSSTATLTNVTFSGNTMSEGFGAGMANDYSNPILIDVTFSDNIGTNVSRGGGMSNVHSSPSLTNVTFSHNSAYLGGGMFNDTSSPSLTNVTFYSNLGNSGGGMYNGSSSPSLTNITFAHNSVFAAGGGMLNNGSSSPQIRNTIFWGNSAGAIVPAGTAQIGNINSSISSVSDSIVSGGCPTYSICTNVIVADPYLGYLGDFGGSTETYSILAGSSAIDAGNDATCPTTDQRGVSRPQGEHCDIGAFEFVFAPPPLHVYLPLIGR